MSVIGSNILAGASGQGGGYNLTNSLRFRSSASAYLNRTPASAGNQQTFTISFWVKRGKLGDAQAFVGTRPDGNNAFKFSFDSNDKLNFDIYISYQSTALVSTQVFRDPSAWYHIVAAFDSTQATASNRVKIYVNGSQITSWSTATYPSLNDSAPYNSTVVHNIGRYPYPDSYLDGYLTEFHNIDGQALTPSSFGEYAATTGVWQPKKYAGTYGTNGFYLPFTDNSALTTSSNVGLGKDFSGNGNYWTTNNISITSGATYDSMTDVPTLTSATASNYPTLNPLIGDATLSSANLNISGVDLSRIGTMAFPTTGKWYFEMTLVANAPSSNWDGVGIGSVPMNTAGGSIYIYRANATKLQTGGSNVSYGSTFETGDVIGVAFDSTAGTLVFYKNNTSQGTAFSGITGEFFPLVYARGITSSPTLAFNAGQRPFAYTPPTGFVALNTFNLPTPTIGATASTQANKYFDAQLWTGNGTSQTLTTTGSFSPDFVWIKSRSGANSHFLTDTVRGATKTLFTNSTGAEATETQGLTAFTSTGFTVGSDASVNSSGSSYVGWAWDANGTGVTNTAGSITSTVSANTSSGFSVVTYTAPASGSFTVGHGLGVAPAMIITKSRSNSGYVWGCYHQSIGNTGRIDLNSTAATVTSVNGAWNNTSPTSSVFTVGLDWAGSGITYVAYCFSAVAGYSAFGSYTGNGSTDGTFVYTGFRPRYILLKRTNAIANWLIYDTARANFNLVNNLLLPDSSSSELTSADYNLDILSNGFKLRTVQGGINGSSDNIIYACFAENPFKYSLAR